MPIYDYVCSACSHRVEVIHGIHDAGPYFCPNCGTEGSMRKALATPAIHFKGSGWAKKDRSSTSGARSKPPASGDSAASAAAKPAAASGDSTTGAGAPATSSAED